MTNSHEDTNSLYNNPMTSDFPDWAYDLHPDDDEFRAGYPFSDIPELELSDDWEPYHHDSPPFDNNAYQPTSASGDTRGSITGKNDQLTEVSIEQPPSPSQDKQTDHRLESCSIYECDKHHETHPNESNGHNKEEFDENHQNGIESEIKVVTVQINH